MKALFRKARYSWHSPGSQRRFTRQAVAILRAELAAAQPKQTDAVRGN